MTLYIYSENAQLRKLLTNVVESRRLTDSGFDIPILEQKVDCSLLKYTFYLNVVVAALDDNSNQTPCLLVPRSSLSNTQFRISNSIGLIDSGYRGEVQARTDVLSSNSTISLSEGMRLFQICKHDFLPWKKIVVVDSLNDMPSPTDNRGTGGFGSTGK